MYVSCNLTRTFHNRYLWRSSVLVSSFFFTTRGTIGNTKGGTFPWGIIVNVAARSILLYCLFSLFLSYFYRKSIICRRENLHERNDGCVNEIFSRYSHVGSTTMNHFPVKVTNLTLSFRNITFLKLEISSIFSRASRAFTISNPEIFEISWTLKFCCNIIFSNVHASEYKKFFKRRILQYIWEN